jgi:spore germination cell wall hydrolase CwlJ-like protein
MKKYFVFIIAITLQLSLSAAFSIETWASDSGDSHLRIFTPYHEVKQEFKSMNETESGKDTQTVKIQRQISQDEIDLIAQIVYAESKGEPFIGKVGVASVILNRLYHPDFPKSVEGVIFQKNAFSCISNGKINVNPDAESYEAVNEALNGNDPTNDSIYFYNPKHSSSSWIKNCPKKSAITIGNHVFFK